MAWIDLTEKMLQMVRHNFELISLRSRPLLECIRRKIRVLAVGLSPPFVDETHLTYGFILPSTSGVDHTFLDSVDMKICEFQRVWRDKTRKQVPWTRDQRHPSSFSCRYKLKFFDVSVGTIPDAPYFTRDKVMMQKT